MLPDLLPTNGLLYRYEIPDHLGLPGKLWPVPTRPCWLVTPTENHPLWSVAAVKKKSKRNYFSQFITEIVIPHILVYDAFILKYVIVRTFLYQALCQRHMYVLSHLILPATLWGRNYNNFYFRGKDNNFNRLKSHKLLMGDGELELICLTAKYIWRRHWQLWPVQNFLALSSGTSHFPQRNCLFCLRFDRINGPRMVESMARGPGWTSWVPLSVWMLSKDWNKKGAGS